MFIINVLRLLWCAQCEPLFNHIHIDEGVAEKIALAQLAIGATFNFRCNVKLNKTLGIHIREPDQVWCNRRGIYCSREGPRDRVDYNNNL